MQFIPDGPDIPDALLQAHEEGRVVFFCGAGISYPAGLPGFKGLVNKLYESLSVTAYAVQSAAIKAGQFDSAIGLLEVDIVGGRERVRKALAGILAPDLSAPNATATHEALLTLGQCRNGQTRLVTTNFDRLFEEVIAAKSLPIERFRAPLLPVPKNRWDGLVYLHGLLTAEPTASDLDRLVVSSGDFGLAYLTERWAARFVSELFRNYIVCFIGYSINDPVLRYMMDALAADRLLGESPPEMFAFGSYSKGKHEERANEWRAKNVTPILYLEHNRHAYLHNSLRAWAETYRDGAGGKEAIVVRYANSHPQRSTQEDDFVGRMLWALSDPSGLPAKRFAELNPVPPLEWLFEALSKERYAHVDLSRFGVRPHEKVDDELKFSLVERPAPYHLAPRMQLASWGRLGSGWDPVMHHLADWLVRHLDDPRLILWVAQRGGMLDQGLHARIKWQLDRLARLGQEGKTAEIEAIRQHAPKAIPSEKMRILWRLLLAGRGHSAHGYAYLSDWWECFKHQGLTFALRSELRDLLAPKVHLSAPFDWGMIRARSSQPDELTVKDVEVEVVLASNQVRESLHEFQGEHWRSALPRLLDDFQFLLRDALDLQRELGLAEDHFDQSHWKLPSISDHWQNRGHTGWGSLIELLRDAWLEILTQDQRRARRIALCWFEIPYPTFKRLALFAATQDGCIKPSEWLDWLLGDEAWWLWASETRREVCRLIVLQGRSLAEVKDGQERLTAAILAGPPRQMYREGLSHQDWQESVDWSVWLRLVKLKESGLGMLPHASERWDEIAKAHPNWLPPGEESDEFSSWTIGTGDPGFEKLIQVTPVPRTRRELVDWLKRPPKGRWQHEQSLMWQEVCRTRFFHSLLALGDLAREGLWPSAWWRAAFYAWSEKDVVSRSWRYATPLLQRMPDAVLLEIDSAVTSWMKSAVQVMNQHEDIMLDLSQRIIKAHITAKPRLESLPHSVKVDGQTTEAQDLTVGLVAEVLLHLSFRRRPEDGDRIPGELKPLLTYICDPDIKRFRYGRVVLGWYLVALFRLDRDWTLQHLLPLFRWQASEEARDVWQGFLRAPRIHVLLLQTLKQDFLECAGRMSDLGEMQSQFVRFLTDVALTRPQGYTVADFREAFKKLSPSDLIVAAQFLKQALHAAGNQRQNYWQNRVLPFWQDIWPKSLSLVTPGISESLAELCIAADSEFPAALTKVLDWLQPIEHPYRVIHRLHGSGLCDRFPSHALQLLAKIVNDQLWGAPELEECLELINKSDPSLAQDASYQRLGEYARRLGG